MSVSELNDNLVVRMGQEDGEAFRQLYLASSSIVYGYALSILKNRTDAEDVMHDAYIRAYQGAASYQPRGKPLAWLLTIVRNLSYNKLRNARPAASIDEHEDAASTCDEQATVDRLALQAALKILDLQERQIVILHALTGLKHREIAEILELPTGTVLSKYHRALKRLRGELAGKGDAR